MKQFIFFFLFLLAHLKGMGSITTIYNTLDPTSASQALAFYELYPHTPEGHEALSRANDLLKTQMADFLVPLVNRVKGENHQFSEEELQFIEQLASHLPNRNLKGYWAKSEKEVFNLPSDEIDLGNALLLSQYSDQEEAFQQARHYSALLDLMALQILSRLSPCATVEERIKAANHFIFEEMHFRFPPQSLYAKDIDLYTFLPSVMDNHLGVCLGVTTLYLAISQRIDLPLEIITPPGHIYIRYREGERIVNIETTARGIDPPSERYLSVNTRSLQMRTLKEVIGMAHFNQASVYLRSERFKEAALSYEKALPYMPNDPLLKELLAYCYLFIDRKNEGKKLLLEIQDFLPDQEVTKRSTPHDFLSGKIDVEGIKAVFTPVDETRESIINKQKKLQEILARYPKFREGLHQLAVTWIQLNRAKEAIASLTTYHQVDPDDPVVEYYLAALHAERHDYKSAWMYLQNAEAITARRGFSPKPLKELRRELLFLSPEEI